MRRLCLIILALTLALAMLAISVAPAMADKPEPKNPVAWVDSSINYAGYLLPSHPRHALTVRLLADGTTVGQVRAGVGGAKMYSTETEWGTFRQGWTYFWSWDDNGVEVKMVDFAVFMYFENQGNVGLIRYQIADYGEPGVGDWHRIWYWELAPTGHWVPAYGLDLRIPYVGGNAIVHGDLTYTGPPSDWDPENLGIPVPSPK